MREGYRVRGKMKNARFAIFLPQVYRSPQSLFTRKEVRMDGPRHLTEDSVGCLNRILDSDTDVAIWRRRGIPAMHRLFRDGMPDDVPHVTLATSLADFASDLEKRDALQHPRWQPIVDDLRMLVSLYTSLSGAGRFRVRLERPKDDGCRLFHVDNVRLRLVVTYFGPGTEWIAENDLDRSGLNRGDNALVVKGKNVIRRVPRFSVAMLKGEKFSGRKNAGAVHRSPPIVEEALERFLVVIDELIEQT
jgi:hypothetical protein